MAGDDRLATAYSPYITSGFLAKHSVRSLWWIEEDDSRFNLRPGGDSASSVLAPRAVLGERFYRSRSWPL